MAYKTIYKAAYAAITIDSQKIDEHYMAVIEKEMNYKDAAVMKEISEFANKNEIGFEDEIPAQQAQVMPLRPIRPKQRTLNQLPRMRMSLMTSLDQHSLLRGMMRSKQCTKGKEEVIGGGRGRARTTMI